jgi:ABC-2 type transport system permease protein
VNGGVISMEHSESSAIPNAPQLRGWCLYRLLLWVHWRSFIARLRAVRKQSRLLLFVLTTFVIGYLFAGYWLFAWGLRYLLTFPIVGPLLAQRILFLIFGFFFLMLVFSNLIVGYSTLFKNRETAWLLTLPVSHRDVYRWKFLESLTVSSWALIFLSTPLMMAYGRILRAPPFFYVEVALAYLPFVVLPALLGSWMIIFMARLLARAWVKKALIGIALCTLIAIGFAVKPVTGLDAAGRQEAISFEQLLRHTRATLHPLLPSAWLARAVLAWSEGLVRQGGFFLLVLMSHALMGLLIGFRVIGRYYYKSWDCAASARSQRLERLALSRNGTGRVPLLDRVFDRVPFLSRPVKALALKDARTFWRDPAQWTQFMIFFGLLCIYVLNLRNVAFDFQNDFWEMIISYLNLTASALTLSTLTTRFVFPQFSLEGRRLWILGLAPIGLGKILLQKFALSCLASAAITVALMAASSAILHLDPLRVLFFSVSIALMSCTLCGLAVGLGALFPNLKEDDPSKIVSGFGGTLCLVVSFVYIACFIGLAAIPGLRRVTSLHFVISDTLAVGLALALSSGVLFTPLLLAMRRVKNLEF